MNEADISLIADWTVQRGLAGDDEIALLVGFCTRCVDAGLEISGGTAIIDTLHPVYEGRVFFWSRDNPLDARKLYGRGALLVSNSVFPAGCLAWSRAI